MSNPAIQIVHPEVEMYLASLLPERAETLRAMERQASGEHIPIIGPLCGTLLYQQARAIGARRCFELGSAIGYSTLWLAMAVGPGGEVHWSDGSEARRAEAEAYLARAGLRERVVFHTGDALPALAATPGEFDLIFNDIDKWEYPAALAAAVPRLRRGGLLVTDNTLWSGRVVAPSDDTWTEAVRRFNVEAYARADLVTTVVPLRDGFTLSLKV
jgi:predicted O-methyltransferase YrrM